MASNSKSDIRRYERTRAAGFVLRYEMEIAAKLRANPYAGNAALATALITRLKSIRGEIMGAVAPLHKPLPTQAGDFSLEEIEAALDIVNEVNIFEE